MSHPPVTFDGVEDDRIPPYGWAAGDGTGRQVAQEQVPEQAPGRDGGAAGRRIADQPSLPFEEAAQDPIPYALTARARRTVAPATLPELSVVPDPEGRGTIDDPDPFDPRPARARALRRAGRDASEIAGLLGVGEDVVTAWCRTVGPRADRRRARSGGGRSTSGGGEVRHLPLPEPDRAPQRDRGRDQGVGYLRGSGAEAVVVAFVAGRARLTPHAATFPVDGPDQAARIIGWLVELAGADPSRARLVLEVERGVAHDLVEARWERGTGIAPEHITVSGGTAEGGRATLRIADPDVAAVLSGWQDAFMEVSIPSDEQA